MRNPGPPETLESVVSALTPVPCREHVLGDLYERYRGNAQYLSEALTILPMLVWSSLLRRSQPRILLMEAAATCLSFLAASWKFSGAAFFLDGSALLRLGVPAVATCAAIWLCDVYWQGPYSRKWPVGVQSAAVALGPVLSVGFVLSRIGWQAPPLLFGGVTSLVLVCGLRMAFAPGALRLLRQSLNCREVEERMSPDELRRAAIRMYRRGQAARNMLWMVVWVPAAADASTIWRSTSVLQSVGCAVSLAGLFYSVFVIQKACARGGRLEDEPSVQSCIEFCRSNLEGRRDLLLQSWPVLAPLLVGTLLVMAADPGTPVFWRRLPALAVAAVFYPAVAWFAKRRVPAFERQIEALSLPRQQR